MNIYAIVISLLILFIYSGCTTQYNVQITENKLEQVTELSILSKRVKELDAHDKQLIYRSIQNEINIHNNKGDEAYESGYNSDAIIAYELVNFYEGYATVPIKKIEKIKNTARHKSRYHYKRALKYAKSNKKRAIREFNKVMMSNPNYKDTVKRLNALKANRDIKIYINTLDSSLRTKFLNNSGTISELKDINSNLKELLQYDYKNEVAIKIKKVIKKYYKVLLDDAIKTYHKGSINRAKNKFSSIVSIYEKDPVSISYLNEIKIKESKQLNMQIAEESLRRKEYIKSMKFTQKILDIDSNNEEAKRIMLKAKKESVKEVVILIEKGKRYYNNKNLDMAKQSFQAALEIDPNNNPSIIYAKKIDRQLKTIKSLQ